MKRSVFYLLSAAILLSAVFVITACVPRLVIQPQAPDIVIAPTGGTVTQTQAPTGNSDRHFIQPDDYFILDDALGNETWQDAYIAKMITPPSEGSKFQGQFLRVVDGNSVWTKYFAKTRIATAADLVLGKEVYVFGAVDDNGYKRPPESNLECRTGWWVKSRIVDTSELYRKVVILANGDQARIDALRVDM